MDRSYFWFFSLLFLFYITLVSSLKAEPFAIGVNAPVSHYGERAPLSDLVRSAVSGALLSAEGIPHSELVAALETTSDFRGWYFALAADAVFSNGQPVTLNDVVFSLQRCKESGVIPSSIRIVTRSQGGDGGVVQVFVSPEGGKDYYAVLVKALSQCSILPRTLVQLFGDEYMSGTNFIGLGEFLIKHFKKNGDLTLFQTKRSTHLEVTLVVDTDFEQGLSKLREGELLGYFTTEAFSESRIQEDETLMVIDCEGYKLIKRRSARVDCPSRIRFYNLGYDQP